MRLAKATSEDFALMNDFNRACEALMDNRFPFGFSRPKAFHEDDPEAIELAKIRKDIAEEEGLSENDVDGRIVAFEFLSRRYNAISGWVRVVLGAQILIDSCCDPVLDHLDWYPGITISNVAPEQ